MSDDLIKVTNDYGTDQIDSLDGLEAVRKRPGMYIGSTSQKGVTHLVWEVTDNCFDEFLAGYGDEITILVRKDGSVVVNDHGRGIPVGPHHKWKNPDGTPQDTLTGILTKLHAGGKFNGEDSGYKCFVEGSLVKTPSGVVKIEEISNGEFVINSFNDKDVVDNVFKYEYDGEITTIYLENGKEISAIDGHFILIQRDNQFVWITIENIVDTDFLVELEEDDDIDNLRLRIPRYEIIKY